MFTMSSLAENFAHFTSGMAVMFFVFTSIHLYKHKFTKKEENNAAPDSKQNESNNNSSFAQKLDLCMEKEKLYLNPQLTIIDLANALKTNRTYLSDYLNKQLNTNFYEYVNTFRIKKASSMLVSENIEKLDTIAETCGFNSLSTFRRAFLKKTGETPSQYRKNFVYLQRELK